MPIISLHCDSLATMSRTLSKIYNGKFISLLHEYIREIIFYWITIVVYVRSRNNFIGPFTNALSWDFGKVYNNRNEIKVVWVTNNRNLSFIYVNFI